MNIGGLLPFTLSDYPGRLAAVIFAQGCNFRCPFCHNGRLIPTATAPDGQLGEREAIRFLHSRVGRLTGVVVSGGEPTLQPDLARFLLRVQTLGYAVKLDTNGSRPEVLRLLLAERLVDFVAMDVKASWTQYDRLAGVVVDVEALRASAELIARSGVPHEFRTTVVPQLLAEADLNAINRELPPGSSHRRQVFCPAHALAPWLRGDAAHSAPSNIHPTRREGALLQ